MDRADCREAKSLLAYCHSLDVMPLAITVGVVRLELAAVSRGAATRTPTAPSADDGNRLVREYGGAALAKALEDAEQQGMEPTE